MDGTTKFWRTRHRRKPLLQLGLPCPGVGAGGSPTLMGSVPCVDKMSLKGGPEDSALEQPRLPELGNPRE